jgi:DNA-binding response OmpR family regulator
MSRCAAILVIEDDEILRESLCRRLASEGHAVRESAYGAGGLELFRAEANGFDLVILDLALPDMGGTEVLAAMLRERPEQRVLLMSGSPRASLDPLLAANPRLRFLPKPFGGDELRITVRSLLDL